MIQKYCFRNPNIGSYTTICGILNFQVATVILILPQYNYFRYKFFLTVEGELSVNFAHEDVDVEGLVFKELIKRSANVEDLLFAEPVHHDVAIEGLAPEELPRHDFDAECLLFDDFQ